MSKTVMFNSGVVVLLIFVQLAYAAEDPAAASPQETAARDWREKIQAALQADFPVDLEETPLKDFALIIAERAGINVLVDERALDDAGIGVEAPLTHRLRGVSLRSVLRIVLRELELTSETRDGALVITTPEATESHLSTKVYNVRDLAGPADPTVPGRYDCAEVVQLITATVAPYSWEFVGGPGAIAQARGQLIVEQTDDVHEELAELLEALRDAIRIAGEHTDSAPPAASIAVAVRDARNERLRQVLRTRRIAIDYQNTPLSDVAKALSDQLGISVVIDTRALNEVGIGPDVTVTFRAEDMIVEHALAHLLKPLDLTYHVRDEVLLITTREESERELLTRLYPVADLLGPVHGTDLFGHKQRPMTADELADLFAAAVVPQTWEMVGGPGSVACLNTADVIVVWQTDDVHQRIGDVLAELRASLAESVEEPVAAADSPMRLKVYLLPTVTEQADGPGAVPEDELLILIQSLIDPQTWRTRGDVYGYSTTGRLIIRHTDAVHRRIDRLLAEMHVTVQQPAAVEPGGPLGGGMF